MLFAYRFIFFTDIEAKAKKLSVEMKKEENG